MYRVEVKIKGETEYVRNYLTFDDIEEAKGYGYRLAAVWTVVVSWIVLDIDDEDREVFRKDYE